MKKKRVLLTGASGFIGNALIKHLYPKYDLIGIDRRPLPEDCWYLKKLKFYQYDIIDQLPDLKDIYAVIHLAANPGVRDSRENFENVCRDNILGTQKIFDICVEKWKPTFLLYASSSSIYGDNGRDGHALKEDESVSPRSPYAMSKIANEQLMYTYKNAGLFEEINCVGLRFFTCYGENQRNELAIRAFTDWILRDKPITLYGTGKQVRDFTHISDICRGIESFLNESDMIGCIDSRFDSQIYNIGSGDCRSINDIIYLICKITGKDVTIHHEPRNCYDVDRTLADISKLRNATCWRPEIKFEDGLKQQIEWQKEQFKSEQMGKSLSESSKYLGKEMKKAKR